MTQSRKTYWPALIALMLVIVSRPAAAALNTANLSTTTPTALANALVGAGVSISNISYTGANVAAGTFTGGTGIIGFEQGVILSSGDIANVIGPNEASDISTINNTAGDAALTTLAGFETFDAAILEFDFIPNASTVFFQYVFASDEYNEFVGSEFNDVFAFYINGVNCARVGNPLVAITINTINNGNPFGSGGVNASLYRNNDPFDGGSTLDTEMDGLTVVLTCQATVTPNATNHIRLAIADTADSIYDANVFLRTGSFTTISPNRKRAQVTGE